MIITNFPLISKTSIYENNESKRMIMNEAGGGNRKQFNDEN